MRPSTLRMLVELRRPTGAQFAIAGLLGIVFGALSAGFAMALGLFLLTLGVFALWQIVSLLAHIAAAVDKHRPARHSTSTYGGRR